MPTNSSTTPLRVKPTVTLVDLALSASTIALGAAAGAVVGAIQNKASGGTVSVFSPQGRFAKDSSDNLLVGLSSMAPGVHRVRLTQTHPTATNSPRTNYVNVTVSAGVTDTTPSAFGFTDQTGVAAQSLVVSDLIKPTAFDTATPISITGGEYRINERGEWRTAASTLNPGDTVRVRHAAMNATNDTVLTIGGVSDTFTSTVSGGGGGGGGGGPQISDKTVQLFDANRFYVTGPPGPLGGKAFTQEFRRNDGSNDAGTAHETWRICLGYKADRIDQSTVGAGYKQVYASNGSSDYAFGLNDGVGVGRDGGSFHGGETDTTPGGQQVLFDDIAFDPTTTAATGKKFQIKRKSRVTWTTATTQVNPYLDVDYTLTWEQDNKIEQTFTVVGGPTTVFDQSAGSATNGFCDVRYTQLWSADGTTLLKQFTLGQIDTYQLPTAQSGSFRMVDPTTGTTPFNSDYMIWTYSVTGRTLYGPGTAQSDTGLSIGYDTNYQKFRIKHGAGPVGTFTVTQTREWFNANPSTLTAPFTENFPGSALPANWKVISQGNAAVNVSANQLLLTGGGSTTTWGFPVNPTNGPGTYRLSFNYQTGGAYTGGSVTIARSDTVSTGNPLVATQSLNSPGGATFTVDMVIGPNESPWVKIGSPGTAARTCLYGPIGIIKIA